MMRRLTVFAAIAILTAGCGAIGLGALAMIATPTLGFGYRMGGDAIEASIPSVGRFCATEDGTLGLVEATCVTTRVCKPLKDGTPVVMRKKMSQPGAENTTAPITVPHEEVQEP